MDYEGHLERLLRVATCLAACGYAAQVGALAGTARAFYDDAQVWGAQARHRGASGRTHLMHAAWSGNTARVQFLLGRGVAVDAREARGGTAQTAACHNGHLETARYLVECGGASVNAAMINGVTALMAGCFFGHLETVRFLVERGGASVNAAMIDGTTALLSASCMGHLGIARYLVEHGGTNVDAARTADGTTALLFASYFGYTEIVRCLVERGGANVNAATFHGFTALMEASAQGHLAIVHFLLQRGADKHALNGAGETAHALAASHPLVQAALA